PTIERRVTGAPTNKAPARGSSVPRLQRRARRLVVVRPVPTATTTDKQLDSISWAGRYQHRIEAHKWLRHPEISIPIRAATASSKIRGRSPTMRRVKLRTRPASHGPLPDDSAPHTHQHPRRRPH